MDYQRVLDLNWYRYIYDSNWTCILSDLLNTIQVEDSVIQWWIINYIFKWFKDVFYKKSIQYNLKSNFGNGNIVQSKLNSRQIESFQNHF